MANKIQTLPEYLERLRCYEGQTVVFRGTDCRWKMLPAITRSFCHRRAMRNDVDGKVIASEWFQDGPPAEAKEELEEYESTIFDSFRRQARSYLASQPSSPWEWLALAQHNELPTRLLDWSKNPLAAAYFAVEQIKGSRLELIRKQPKKSPNQNMERKHEMLAVFSNSIPRAAHVCRYAAR